MVTGGSLKGVLVEEVRPIVHIEVEHVNTVREVTHERTAVDEQAALKVYSTQHLIRRIILLSVFLVAVAFVSFTLGRYTASPAQIWLAIVERVQFCSHYLWALISRALVTLLTFQLPTEPITINESFTDAKLQSALFDIRFPRIILVILVGLGLSMAGASYQGMFKNPLVSPDLLGAAAGASFGACLAMLLNLSNGGIQILAFIGGMAAVFLVMGVNRAVRSDAILGLILGGILVGTLFQSGTSIIKLVADADDKLPAITFWLMGSFARITLKDLLIFLPMVAGLILLLSQSWNLNVLSFGEEEARSLGVNTRRTRFIVIFAATLLTSCSVAMAGIIGWIGLVVPHLTRAIVGPNYKVLLPTTMLVGSAFLLLVDDVARLLLAFEIPIGLLTSVLGVPFFAFIYRRNMKGW